MTDYEVILRGTGRDEVRQISYPLIVGDTVRFGDQEWRVERAEAADDPDVARRYICTRDIAHPPS